MARETVLVGQFSHETNTFAPTPTDVAAFRARQEYAGDEVIDRLRGTNTTVGGAVDVADAEGLDLVPTVAASATPGGPVAREAYDHYTGEILDVARERATELDGVFLSLHGAMVPEGGDDGEGPLLAAVREVVGDDVPVVATLDLHGNVTREMCEAADALVAFESYPHVDMGDTGRRGMGVLVESMRTGRDLVTRIERPPMLPYGPLQNTRDGPMAELMALARDVEERPGVEKISVFPGFHKADIPSMGPSVVAVGEDGAAADEAARAVAARWWETRESFVADFPDPEEAVRDALARLDETGPDDGPVVLADAGDNPGGGGTGDETAVLRELVEQGAANAGFVVVYDPESVADCVAAGVGEDVSLTLGGKGDGGFTDPLDVEARVSALTDGEFRNTGPMGTGTENHLGRTALVECDAGDGRTVSVVVTERRQQPLDAELWRHVGRQPERFDVIAVKSNNHYRADYEPMASHVITVNSPGLAAFDPHRYDYQRVRRPKYPLDEGATYPLSDSENE
ncbi:MAG: M81 family metallopeptidase [Haloferacaceae archaeon]